MRTSAACAVRRNNSGWRKGNSSIPVKVAALAIGWQAAKWRQPSNGLSARLIVKWRVYHLAEENGLR
jgi:hypothetical protein